MWLSLVERLVRDQEAASSNLATPTSRRSAFARKRGKAARRSLGEGGLSAPRTAELWLASQIPARRRIGNFMKYVYLLQSIPFPNQRYVGLTDDLQKRLANHNSGGSSHTAKFKPWKIAVAIRFNDGCKAAAFEQYLKSGSGRAFSSRHFF